ncbi:MAG: hypothetical protein ACOCWY_03970, partial [Thermodesulfobacteriota bacterium]
EYALNEIFVPLTETFQPQLILMVDGSDPHFTDRITQMGVTLKGIQKIGNLIGRVADDICGGKLIDFIGSGYSRSLQIVSLGWLASVSGVTGVRLELEEPRPAPAGIRPEAGLEEVKTVVRSVRNHFAPYWRCFSGSVQ